MQGAVHPDRMGLGLGSFGESWSSWINRAHETLKNPLNRAIYLVNLYETKTGQLNRGNASENEKESESESEKKSNDDDNNIDKDNHNNIDKDNHNNIDNDSDNLHDISLVLEVREELDSAVDPAVLTRIKSENDERI